MPSYVFACAPKPAARKLLGVAVLFAVTVLVVATASADQLTLTWDDNSAGTAGFKIERRLVSAGAYSQIGTTGAGVTTHQDTVDAGTTYCYRVRAFNSAGDSAYSNEACGSSAGPTGPLVTVTRMGTGSGTVTSSPAGISCGSDCFESFAAGTTVTLTATPSAGSTFSGWTAGCSGTAPCTIAGNTPVTVTAAFAAPPPTGPVVTVTKMGTGSGTVTSSPAGISCGSDCFESFAAGTIVTLTATPSVGSTFSGWTAGCSGTAPCTIAGNTPVTVTAAFAATSPGDTTPPTKVGGLVATAVSSSRIDLNWTASTDAVGVTAYRVERCQGRKCSNFVQIAAPSGTSYSNTGLSPNTRYRYRVRATDAAGNLGSYSRIVAATTQR